MDFLDISIVVGHRGYLEIARNRFDFYYIDKYVGKL
jgi:hypothetical protein